MVLGLPLPGPPWARLLELEPRVQARQTAFLLPSLALDSPRRALGPRVSGGPTALHLCEHADILWDDSKGGADTFIVLLEAANAALRRPLPSTSPASSWLPVNYPW